LNRDSSTTFRTNDRGFRRDGSAPSVPVPFGTCDTHMHIVGPYARFPLVETRSLTPPEATLSDYRETMRRTGITRNVIVQPSFFAKDNTCTLESVKALGADARAVVVVDPDVDEATLQYMHACGARGVRVQRVVAGGASIEDIEKLAARIHPYGWHLQLFVDAVEIAPLLPVLRRLPVDVVFDHMAHVQRDGDMSSAGFRGLLDLLREGRTWVKLSNARFVPDAARARALVEANPARALWGSDWPHVAYQEDPVPDEGHLLDSLAEWVADDSIRRRILVDNPARLYFGA
jgi:predicted TIM-barrel fold metal-dependent hydrolase